MGLRQLILDSCGEVGRLSGDALRLIVAAAAAAGAAARARRDERPALISTRLGGATPPCTSIAGRLALRSRWVRDNPSEPRALPWCGGGLRTSVQARL